MTPALSDLARARRHARLPALVLTTMVRETAPQTHWLSVSHANTIARRTLAQYIVRRHAHRAVLFFLDESRTALGRLTFDAFRLLPELTRLHRDTQVRFVIRAEHRCTHQAYFARLYTQLPPSHITSRLSKYEPVQTRQGWVLIFIGGVFYFINYLIGFNTLFVTHAGGIVPILLVIGGILILWDDSRKTTFGRG